MNYRFRELMNVTGSLPTDIKTLELRRQYPTCYSVCNVSLPFFYGWIHAKTKKRAMQMLRNHIQRRH